MTPRGAVVASAVAAVLVSAARARADGGGAPPYQTVVTGTRSEEPLADAPVATEVIGREELEASGADDVAEALEAHPGLVVERGLAGTVIQVQGLDPEHTLVLVDGQRVIGRVGGGLDLSRLPITDVERIEIVKGPGSALYGSDAIGGVVNIITRRPRPGPSVEGTASAGGLGVVDTRVRAGDSLGPLRLSVSLGWQRGDAWDLEPEDLATTAGAYDTRHAALEVRVKTSPRWRLDADVRWMHRDRRAVDLSGAGAILDRRNLTETVDASLAGEWKPTLPTRLRASLHGASFRDQFVSDQRGADDLDQYQDSREHLVQGNLQGDWLIGGHFLGLGSDVLWEDLRSPRLDDGHGERARGGLYLQDEWFARSAPGRVTLVSAVRLDVDSSFGAHVTPRVAVRWDVAEPVVLRASVGLGYRAPDFKELYLFFENPGVGYVVEGNPDLAPETSRSATTAVEWRATSRLWASLGLFRHDLSDLILAQLVDDGGGGGAQRFSYVNVAAATSQGGELMLRAAPSAWLQLDAGYAFTDARDDQRGERLDGRATHRATFTLRLAPPRGPWLVTVCSVVSGTVPFTVDDDGDGMSELALADPHVTLDLRARWRLHHHLDLFAGGENLTGAGDPRFNPLPPRTFHVGASARY